MGEKLSNDILPESAQQICSQNSCISGIGLLLGRVCAKVESRIVKFQIVDFWHFFFFFFCSFLGTFNMGVKGE